MCTVTYIPPTKKTGFILTSNRDERVQRKAMAPGIHISKGKKLVFPIDSRAGGSWIAASEGGRLCCLLNGGLEPHKKQSFNTYSRGRVLLDFVATDTDIHGFFRSKDLSKVEPFTIITIEHKKESIIHFSESLWDGEKKHYRNLHKKQHYIWSSVTLYNHDEQITRKAWFQKFIQESDTTIKPEDVLNFHSGIHTSDRSINVLMERVDGLKTVSITQVTPLEKSQLMKYIDLVEDRKYEIEV